MTTPLLPEGCLCPYPGPRPFRRDEAEVFFGREAQLDALLNKLAKERFLAVLGPSGCGKTSLVEAGLIPGLEGGLLVTGVSGWRISRLWPGDRPLERLAHLFIDLHRATKPPGYEPEEDVQGLREEFELDRRSLVALLDRVPGGERKNNLVVVDRFEEIFQRPDRASADDVRAFVALLLATAQSGCPLLGAGSPPCSTLDEALRPCGDLPAAGRPCSTPVYIVVVLRAEYLGDCGAIPGLSEAINRGLFLVPGLSDEQYSDAIVLPARQAGGDVEGVLVDQLVKDVRRCRDPLPLLQHALALMWSNAPAAAEGGDPASPAGADAPAGRRLTLAGYEPIGDPVGPAAGQGGGLAGCLSKSLDGCLRQLRPEQRAIARAMFLALNRARTLRLDGPGRVSLAHLAERASVAPGDLLPVVEVFRGPGFLIGPTGRPKGDDSLEIAHESLFRQWGRFREWRGPDQADDATAPRVYDVFLSYHSVDLAEVKQIWGELKGRGIAAWLDDEDLPPGASFQTLINQQILTVRAAAVFFGRSLGPWHAQEMEALLGQATRRPLSIIPVILKSCLDDPDRWISPMYQSLRRVDFRDKASQPLEQLIWGITGKRPAPGAPEGLPGGAAAPQSEG
jgi:hypothetical protein